MKVLKRVFRIMTPRQRHLFVVLFFMMLIGAALETMGTGLILPLITAVTNPDAVIHGRMRIVYDMLGMESVNQFLLLIILAECVIYIAKPVYMYFMYYVQYRYVYNGQYNTSLTLFKEYMSRSYEYYLNANTPVVIRNIVSCVSGSYNLILTFLQLFTEATVFVALFILAMASSPLMTIIMSAFILLVLMINKKFFGPMLHDFGNEVNANNAQVTKWLLQAMDGMKETKVLNKERYFVHQYEKSSGRLNEIQMKQSSLSNIPRLSVETVVVEAILIMMGIFVGRDAKIGTGSIIAQIGVLAMVAIRIMPSANRIITAVNNITYYEPSLTEVEDLIIHAHQINTDQMFAKDEEVKPLPFRKEVKLENITYRYANTDVDIFRDANLEIPIGKSIGIVGPSGAGKSTAVDLILGLLTPQSGRITVDGTDIQTDLSGWYANIGYVPQMMYMLDDTIRANVAYGVEREKIDDARVWAALEEAQMDEFVRNLPQGLDSGIGERGVRISGGQRQRIGIARALYNDPQIMVFDEATSALDNDTEKAIMDAIERLHGRKTLIIVAHRLTTIEGCDAVYRVENQHFIRVEDPHKMVRDELERQLAH